MRASKNPAFLISHEVSDQNLTPSVAGAWINAIDCGASGSEFQSVGTISSESNEITVEEVGDFQVGQWVTIYHCNPHYYGMVYNEAEPYLAKNQTPLKDELELRGLDENKTWQTFLIHFEKTSPLTFNWMAIDPSFQTHFDSEPVVSRKWCWQGENLPLSREWINLADGVQMRLKKIDWLPGQSVSFHARNRLITKIIDIRNNTLILNDQATCDTSQALVCHNDQFALQSAVDLAIAERKSLFIPAGRYRLSKGLWIRNCSLRVEGAHREHTVLDVKDDHTSVFWISGGKEVVVRNLGMIGHTGFMELPSHCHFANASGYAFWPTANQQMEIKGCAAANIVSTEHILFEDVNVTRMASEVFYLHGSDRFDSPPYIQAPHEAMPELQRQYTKSCIFQRCNVSDCGFNVFNNNDHGENTSILNCRVERAANFCEGAGRFTRIIGNYCLDGCPTSIHGGGNPEDLRQLGPCQAIISDNVFESGKFPIAGGLSISNGATQVIVANNQFIGFSKESAITILNNGGGKKGMPVRSITVTGNMIDLTQMEDNPNNERAGISVSASNVIIANNHIFVRDKNIQKVTGIHVATGITNVNVHDNIISNCSWGLRAGGKICLHQGDEERFAFLPLESEVVEVINSNSFYDKELSNVWDYMPGYSGWHIRWLTSLNFKTIAIVESYDPDKRIITLKNAIQMRTGDKFAIYPSEANWQLHHNTIADCTYPITINSLPKSGVNIRDNTISPLISNGMAQ